MRPLLGLRPRGFFSVPEKTCGLPVGKSQAILAAPPKVARRPDREAGGRCTSMLWKVFSNFNLWRFGQPQCQSKVQILSPVGALGAPNLGPSSEPSSLMQPTKNIRKTKTVRTKRKGNHKQISKERKKDRERKGTISGPTSNATVSITRAQLRPAQVLPSVGLRELGLGFRPVGLREPGPWGEFASQPPTNEKEWKPRGGSSGSDMFSLAPGRFGEIVF